jgi:hypothetical protein
MAGLGGCRCPARTPRALPRRVQELLRQHERRGGIVYGHFGEGCVHVRIDHDLVTPTGREAYRLFQEDSSVFPLVNYLPVARRARA